MAAFSTVETQTHTQRTVNNWPRQHLTPGRSLAPQAARRSSLPVVILVHKMVPGPKGYQPGVVRRSRNRDRPRTPHVRVTQLVGQQLEFVCGETVVVPQDLVVGGPAGSLRRTDEQSAGQHRQNQSWYLTVAPPAGARNGCDCKSATL